jgi:putative membrane protein
MRKIASIAASLMLLATTASAQDKASQKFLTEAIEGNFAEVQMGELAQKSGQSEDVKSFGQMLVTDHGDANKKAMEVAKSMSVTAPNGPNSKQKADYDKMAKMNGAAFDKMFAQHMVADHKKDIAAYKKEAKKTDAAGRYAADTLPTLQKHLDTATSVQRQATAKK